MLIQLSVASWLITVFAASATAASGGHYNIIGRASKFANGRGEIVVDGGGQEVKNLEISVSDGPLTVTKVLVHFADKNVKPWSMNVAPRKDVDWTSRPIKWPSGKIRKVVSVEFWYTGTPGKSARIDLLGLQ